LSHLFFQVFFGDIFDQIEFIDNQYHGYVLAILESGIHIYLLLPPYSALDGFSIAYIGDDQCPEGPSAE
jgi:hypothetical protein